MRRLAWIGLLLSSLAACQAQPPVDFGWWQTIAVGGRDSCIGAAIDARWAVTVRHCVQPAGTPHPAPAQALMLTDRSGAVRRVIRVVVPAGAYNHLGDITGRDVALLRVDRPFSRVAELGAWAEEDGKSLLVRRDNRMSAIPLELMPFNDRSVYSRGVTCLGDSGSPLLDTGGRVTALASWRSEPRCDGGISVYTRLDIHRAWIDAITGWRSRAPAPSWLMPSAITTPLRVGQAG